MEDDAQRPTLAPPGPSAGGGFARWFAFLGGALAWTADIMLSWVIAEFGCVRGLHHIQWLGVSLTAWLAIGLTVVTLAVALAAAWVGLPSRKHRDHGALDVGGYAENADGLDHDDEDPHAAAGAYLLWAGFLLNLLFVLVIIGQSIPIAFYLQRC